MWTTDPTTASFATSYVAPMATTSSVASATANVAAVPAAASAVPHLDMSRGGCKYPESLGGRSSVLKPSELLRLPAITQM